MWLILSVEGLAWLSCANLSFVGHSKYQVVGGCSGAISTSGNALVLHGMAGGAKGA